jgi:hypothetical protein
MFIFYTRLRSTGNAAWSGAIGHPLGASGARLVTTAIYQLHAIKGRYALCTMCMELAKASPRLSNAAERLVRLLN